MCGSDAHRSWNETVGFQILYLLLWLWDLGQVNLIFLSFSCLISKMGILTLDPSQRIIAWIKKDSIFIYLSSAWHSYIVITT